MDATRIKQKQRLKKNKISQILSKNAVLLKSELYKVGSTLPKPCLEKKWGGWWKKGKAFQQHQSILFCVVKIFFILKHKLFVLTYFFLHDTNNFENEKNKATENPCEIEHWPKQLPLLLYCPISFPWKILKLQALFQSGTKHILKSQNALRKRMLTRWQSYCSQMQVDLQRESLDPRLLLYQLDKPTRNMRRMTSFISLLSALEGKGRT